MPRIFTRPTATALLLAAVLTGASGCGSNTTTGGDSGSIALTLSSSSATVQQGDSTSVTGNIVRSGGFTGDVGITVSGVPAGVTGTVTSAPTNGATSARVAIAVATTTTPGTYTLTVQASGSGVTAVSQPFTLVVTAAPPTPTFSLASFPTAVSVAQGATGTALITATRTGGFGGAIVYTTSVTPLGLSNSLSATGTDTPTLTVAPSTGLNPGSYTVTVTAMSGTITRQTAVTVTVTAAPAIRLDFSGCDASVKPVWFAYQDGTGAFIHVTATADVYTFPRFSAAKGAIAVVTLPVPTRYVTQVHYMAQGELNAYSGGCAITAPSTKTINGSVAGLSGSQIGHLSLGTAETVFRPNQLTGQLVGVLPGLRDLVAYRAENAVPSGADRIVIRRDQNIADGGSTGVVDFGAAEAVAPTLANITVTGGFLAESYVSVNYLTGISCDVSVLDYLSSALTVSGVPPSLQRPTDYHQLQVAQGSAAELRAVNVSFHTLADRTVAIGSGVGSLSVSTLAGTYKRYQALFTLAPEYGTANLDYRGSSTPGNFDQFTVDQSAAYLGGSTAIALITPDLSAVGGWQADFAPAASIPLQYVVTVTSSTPATSCVEGATWRTASSKMGIPFGT